MSRRGSLQRIRDQLDHRLDMRKPKLLHFNAYLGDGNGVVVIDEDDPTMVYAREKGRGEVHKVHNTRVPNLYNLPVIIGYDDTTQYRLEVLTIRRDAVDVWIAEGNDPTGISGVGPHHFQHEWRRDGGLPGSDVVWLNIQQITDGLVYPSTPNAMTVEVHKSWYAYGQSFQFFDAETSADLTAYVPSDAGSSKWILISIDAETNTLQYTEGDPFSTALFPPDESDSIPDAPYGSVPLAAVLLSDTTTEITWDEIYDMRLFPTGVSGVASASQHGILDPSVHVNTADHDPPNLGDMIYAGGVYPIWDALAIGTSGEILRSTGSVPEWSPFLVNTIYVGSAGEYTTIQDAMDALTSTDDIILVDGDTYDETLTYSGGSGYVLHMTNMGNRRYVTVEPTTGVPLTLTGYAAYFTSISFNSPDDWGVEITSTESGPIFMFQDCTLSGHSSAGALSVGGASQKYCTTYNCQFYGDVEIDGAANTEAWFFTPIIWGDLYVTNGICYLHGGRVTGDIIVGAGGELHLSGATLVEGSITETGDVEGHHFNNELTLIGPDGEWRVGGKVLDQDFTSSDYDTIAESQAEGVLFSDVDSPFPAQGFYHISTLISMQSADTWSISSGNGLYPVGISADNEGPWLLIPVLGVHDWEFTLDYTITGARSGTESNYVYIIAFSPGQQYTTLYQYNYSYSSQYHRARTYIRTGSSYSNFQGSSSSGSPGTFKMGIRMLNGCPGGWHHDTGSWSNYTSTLDVIAPVTHIGVITARRTGNTWFSGFYIENMQLNYG